MISGAVAIEKENAEQVLRHLLKSGSVNKALKIKMIGRRVHIPVLSPPERYIHDYVEEDFDSRAIQGNPVEEIRYNLLDKGIPESCIPDKWTRYGDSIVINSPCMADLVLQVALEFGRVLDARNVYNREGIVTGNIRKPSLKRITGPGGNTTHLENGIRFTFDPEKVMFSPGNVNERVRAKKEDVEGKEVMDMFCGIGYFSMGLAVYGNPKIIYACDINPDSIEFLLLNAKNNGVSSKIKAIEGDSRVRLPEQRVDLIIMGNFKSEEYLPHALKRIRDGGYIVMHHLVSTENLQAYRTSIPRKVGKYGYKAAIEESHIVKSYGPNFWHVSTKLRILDGGDFG